jgi:hypothetical protein
MDERGGVDISAKRRENELICAAILSIKKIKMGLNSESLILSFRSTLVWCNHFLS